MSQQLDPEYIDEIANDSPTPERRLWLSVVALAAVEALGDADLATVQHARAWFFGTEDAQDFELVCALVGLDARYVRGRVARAVQRGTRVARHGPTQRKRRASAADRAALRARMLSGEPFNVNELDVDRRDAVGVLDALRSSGHTFENLGRGTGAFRVLSTPTRRLDHSCESRQDAA